MSQGVVWPTYLFTFSVHPAGVSVPELHRKPSLCVKVNHVTPAYIDLAKQRPSRFTCIIAIRLVFIFFIYFYFAPGKKPYVGILFGASTKDLN